MIVSDCFTDIAYNKHVFTLFFGTSKHQKIVQFLNMKISFEIITLQMWQKMCSGVPFAVKTTMPT